MILASENIASDVAVGTDGQAPCVLCCLNCLVSGHTGRGIVILDQEWVTKATPAESIRRMFAVFIFEGA
jgi:hypothetical protein